MLQRRVGGLVKKYLCFNCYKCQYWKYDRWGGGIATPSRPRRADHTTSIATSIFNRVFDFHRQCVRTLRADSHYIVPIMPWIFF